ncbi:hypothetical protein Scep_027486 [Stephania cephalantha]|uniref:Uncharacterized protein n=1 Tax=Stephania cephalantha TaxID=152367 RepID=A0AAP0EGG6_9MAGN
MSAFTSHARGSDANNIKLNAKMQLVLVKKQVESLPTVAMVFGEGQGRKHFKASHKSSKRVHVLHQQCNTSNTIFMEEPWVSEPFSAPPQSLWSSRSNFPTCDLKVDR